MPALHQVRTLTTRAAARAAARIGSGSGSGEAGMTTAEYAVGTVAACGFGGVLWKVIENPSVLGALKDVILRALDISFG